MKLIDADKLKEAISEKVVATRKTERNWYKNAIGMMELVDNQPTVLLSCPKCHGKGEYDVYEYDENDMLDSISTNKCELCYGTGTVTVEFYEYIQKASRK